MLKPLPEINVIAFDPGESTGVFMRHLGGGIIVSPLPATYEEMKIMPFENDLPDVWVNLHVVIEDFKLYAHRAKDMIDNSMVSARVIGMIESWCYHWNIVPTFQMAFQAKGLCTDDLLREYGFWINNKHNRDAARHCLYYLLTYQEGK